jgi:predicted nucleic acid-binding protein
VVEMGCRRLEPLTPYLKVWGKIYKLQCAHNGTMIIKDAMVLIHLAKISLLEKSCDHFRNIMIPDEVYGEVLKGEPKGYEDIIVIKGLIEKDKIKVKNIRNKKLMEKANSFNIFRGEAEALALYWQEKADLLATDDDNVRKKKLILNINLIGTPAIILKLFRSKSIDRKKFIQSINELRKIGWFHQAVLDKLLMEVKK